MLLSRIHMPSKILVVSGIFTIRKKIMTAVKEVRSIRVETIIASHYRKTEQYQQKEKPALTMKQTLDLNLHQSGNGT